MNPIFQAVWRILAKNKPRCPKCGAPLPKRSRLQTVTCPQCRAQVRSVSGQGRGAGGGDA
ncbi:MAG: hypothetical protein AB7D07_03790 [Desulfovibrionaceae bacterium]